MSEIAEAAFTYQIALEKGEKKVVGVNTHTDSVTHDLEIMRVSPRGRGRPGAAAGRSSRRRVTTRPCARPSTGWSTPPARTPNMVPAMLDAARAEATLGEICDALRAEWGEYREPARF